MISIKFGKKLVALDNTHEKKSGKKTFGLDRFFQSCMENRFPDYHYLPFLLSVQNRESHYR